MAPSNHAGIVMIPNNPATQRAAAILVKFQKRLRFDVFVLRRSLGDNVFRRLLLRLSANRRQYCTAFFG